MLTWIDQTCDNDIFVNGPFQEVAQLFNLLYIKFRQIQSRSHNDIISNVKYLCRFENMKWSATQSCVIHQKFKTFTDKYYHHLNKCLMFLRTDTESSFWWKFSLLAEMTTPVAVDDENLIKMT